MLESKRTTIAGHDVQYWMGGAGFPILMLHGVGPGTSIIANYQPVLEPLSRHCTIIAPDLIGFGKSARKTAPPFFDVALWVEQGLAMLELLPAGPCGIIGHSLGGALALKIAGRSSRVTKVLTSSSVGAPYALPVALDEFWAVPPDADALVRAMRRMVHDPAAVGAEMVADRWALFQSPGYADYFGAMFAAPRQRYLDAGVLDDAELDRIRARVVMLHGREDQPCPAEATTLAVARRLPSADVHLYGACGHNLPRERTADYLQAAIALFTDRA
ncbi:MAG: alpha/beta fold hydrolase [Stellaceae bacterium]